MMSKRLTPVSDLPPYLRSTEALELEDLPLQVSLLTMELAEHRKALQRLSTLLQSAGGVSALPAFDPVTAGIDNEDGDSRRKGRAPGS